MRQRLGIGLGAALVAVTAGCASSSDGGDDATGKVAAAFTMTIPVDTPFYADGAPFTQEKNDGSFRRLQMQSDGNLVLYDDAAGAVWATSWYVQYSQRAWAGQRTQGMSCGQCYAVFQSDGNVVLYNPAFGAGADGAYWATNTNSPNIGVVYYVTDLPPFLNESIDYGPSAAGFTIPQQPPQ